MSRTVVITSVILGVAAVVGVTAVAPSLSFVSTGFLAGLAAAALPLVIHLINRRRAKVHRFAAVSFLLSSDRRVAQKLKLRQLLLLLVRTLLIACIPLALSKPAYQSSMEGVGAGPGPSATVIILDNSLSMGYRIDGHSLFERAKERALNYLGELPREATAAVIVAADQPDPKASAAPLDLSFDHEQTRARIRAARLVPATSNLEAAVRRADRLLGTSVLPRKRILVLTDGARHAWPTYGGGAEAIPVSSGAALLIRDLSRSKPLANRAVTAVTVTPDPDLGPGGHRIGAEIGHWGVGPLKGVPVSLQVGDKVVARGTIDLPPRGTARKVFHYRFAKTGIVTGAVALDADALPEDDRRQFALEVRRPARALLINGDPRPLPHLDELFYLERALRPTGSPVRIDVVSANRTAPLVFSRYHAVFLCNVRDLSRQRVERLRQFVEAGGGLLISVGDRVDPDVYNSLLGHLLPRRLRSVRDSSFGGGAPVRFSRPVLAHPILSVFAGEALDGLVAGQAKKYMHVEPGTRAEVLLQFDDGAPALLLGRLGRGRVLLMTTTIDRDWTDLPIRTAYLPLMQQAARYLARVLQSPGAAQVSVGEVRTLRLGDDSADEVLVEGPGGLRVRYTAKEIGEKTELRFDRTARPGPYKVTLRKDGKNRLGGVFAVNPPNSESDLRKLGPEQIARLTPRAPESASGASLRASFGQTALWPWIALGLLVFLCIEGFLVRRA